MSEENQQEQTAETGMEAPVETPVAQEVGVDKIEDAIKGIFAISTFLAGRFQDGVGADDALAIFTELQTNEEFKLAVENAVASIKHLKGQAKDIDLREGIGLTKLVLDLVPELLDAINKK